MPTKVVGVDEVLASENDLAKLVGHSLGVEPFSSSTAGPSSAEILFVALLQRGSVEGSCHLADEHGHTVRWSKKGRSELGERGERDMPAVN